MIMSHHFPQGITLNSLKADGYSVTQRKHQGFVVVTARKGSEVRRFSYGSEIFKVVSLYSIKGGGKCRTLDDMAHLCYERYCKRSNEAAKVRHAEAQAKNRKVVKASEARALSANPNPVEDANGWDRWVAERGHSSAYSAVMEEADRHEDNDVFHGAEDVYYFSRRAIGDVGNSGRERGRIYLEVKGTHWSRQSVRVSMTPSDFDNFENPDSPWYNVDPRSVCPTLRASADVAVISDTPDKKPCRRRVEAGDIFVFEGIPAFYILEKPGLMGGDHCKLRCVPFRGAVMVENCMNALALKAGNCTEADTVVPVYVGTQSAEDDQDSGGPLAEDAPKSNPDWACWA